ncbi:hypothetical protein D3C81_1603240 [compost metagenome]
MNIGCKRGYYNTLLCFTENVIQYKSNVLLRWCKARLLSIGAIRQEGEHAVLPDFTHTMQIRKLIIDWSMIEFEVTRMHNITFWSLDAYPN